MNVIDFKRNNELHDYYPKRVLDKQRKYLGIIWVVLFFFVILGFLLHIEFNNFPLDILIVLFIFFAFISIGIIIFVDMTKIPTHWDDFDYSNLIKTDFKFQTSDGLKQFAYFYTRNDIDTDNLEGRRPAIIGLHGWGSHHREMDRYCLPLVLENGYLYFTYDARGQGQTKGNKNDFRQFHDVKEFIDKVKNLSIVDAKRIAVIGMSLGAAKASFAAYPNKNVKLVVMMSGPFDLLLTRKNMSFLSKIGFFLTKTNLKRTDDDMKKYSGINYFKSDGIILEGYNKPVNNNDRVFLIANRDDPLVNIKNTEEAIKKLKLSEKNYRIFSRGNHCHEGNEYNVSAAIFNFVTKKL